MMWAMGFRKEFAPLVRAGTKRQTIRKNRKDNRRPEVGDVIRCYQGLRTYQAELIASGEVTHVFPVVIFFGRGAIIAANKTLTNQEADVFAMLDGFESRKDFLTFFEKTHGPDQFRGFCVRWREVFA